MERSWTECFKWPNISFNMSCPWTYATDALKTCLVLTNFEDTLQRSTNCVMRESGLTSSLKSLFPKVLWNEHGSLRNIRQWKRRRLFSDTTAATLRDWWKLENYLNLCSHNGPDQAEVFKYILFHQDYNNEK